MTLQQERRDPSDPSTLAHLSSDLLKKRHPCFDDAAFCTNGRIHLPVAPLCNVQCIYCLRRFDCVNESRPGVCSQLLRPKEAAKKAIRYLKTHPETSVVGFAGPGDPLANEETFETIDLLRRTNLPLILCLSTNGLCLPESLGRLKAMGLRFLTVTVNSLVPETATKLYCWVNDHGKRLYGRAAAELLIERQVEGIRKALELGFFVKVNTVLLDGVNTDQVQTMAEAFSVLGVTRMNLNSVINVTGDAFIQPVPANALKRMRMEASRWIPQMRACAQCRADAVGIPGALCERRRIDVN